MAILTKMQRWAAIWISGAFRTSPTGGLTGLIPIRLHLKKLRERASLHTATLPPHHAIRSLLNRQHAGQTHLHPLALGNLS